jgi:hypothetical protein
MTFIIIVLLLLGFGVALMFGLISVLEGLVEHGAQDSPIFHDLNAMFHDQVAEYREARSQFAWQSRSHFRGPD